MGRRPTFAVGYYVVYLLISSCVLHFCCPIYLVFYLFLDILLGLINRLNKLQTDTK